MPMIYDIRAHNHEAGSWPTRRYFHPISTLLTRLLCNEAVESSSEKGARRCMQVPERAVDVPQGGNGGAGETSPMGH